MLSLNHIKNFGNAVTVAITDGNGVFISHSDINKVYRRETETNFQTIHQEATAENKIHAFTYEGKQVMIQSC